MRGSGFDYVKSVLRSNQKEKTFAYSQKTLQPRRPFGFIFDVSPSTDHNLRQRITVIYSGHVQGVGFRYTTRTVATGFEVTGIVRNLPDGRVELIAEGQRSELEAFRTSILDAGLAGFIRDERVTWSQAKNEFRGFEIAH